MNLLLFGLFAALALALATIGIYGVLAYSVAQRTREIGIRLALGAHRKDVLRLVISQGMRLASLGILLGLFGAFALTRLMSGMIYGVSSTDPVTFVAVAALLVIFVERRMAGRRPAFAIELIGIVLMIGATFAGALAVAA